MVLDAICNSLTKDPRHNFPQSPPLHILPQIHIFKDISLQRRSVGSTSQSLDFSSDTFQARWTRMGTMGIYSPLILRGREIQEPKFYSNCPHCLFFGQYIGFSGYGLFDAQRWGFISFPFCGSLLIGTE